MKNAKSGRGDAQVTPQADTSFGVSAVLCAFSKVLFGHKAKARTHFCSRALVQERAGCANGVLAVCLPTVAHAAPTELQRANTSVPATTASTFAAIASEATITTTVSASATT